MVDLYANVDFDVTAKSQLGFAIGKALEDIGNFSKSFEYYCQANAFRKKSLKYNVEKDLQLFKKLIEIEPKVSRVDLEVINNKLISTPIFILGMPRSGTTLVEQILSSHPQVFGGGELPNLSIFAHKVINDQNYITSKRFWEFRESYSSHLCRVSNKSPFVTDKMPVNFKYIPFICKIFPEAKIVHVRRDPAATCWSNFKVHFRSKGLGYSYDLNDTVEYFKLYRKITNTWKRIFADQIFDLDYDQLVSQPDYYTRSLLQGLALPWNAACLAPEENRRSVQTASQQQVRKSIYANSSQKWYNFRPFIGQKFDNLDL